MFFVIIFTYLLKVIIQVQSGNEILNRLVLCIKCMELACWGLHCHFGHLPLGKKIDDEKTLLIKIIWLHVCNVEWFFLLLKVESNLGTWLIRDVVRFSNLRVLIVIGCLFLFLSSVRKPQIPGVTKVSRSWNKNVDL